MSLFKKTFNAKKFTYKNKQVTFDDITTLDRYPERTLAPIPDAYITVFRLKDGDFESPLFRVRVERDYDEIEWARVDPAIVKNNPNATLFLYSWNQCDDLEPRTIARLHNFKLKNSSPYCHMIDGKADLRNGYIVTCNNHPTFEAIEYMFMKNGLTIDTFEDHTFSFQEGDGCTEVFFVKQKDATYILINNVGDVSSIILLKIE